MARYFLIGGKTIESNYFERTLLSLAKKEKPLLLFFPTASCDSKKIVEAFHKNFINLNVQIIDVLLYSKSDYKELDELFKKADIIYFSGGNTANLVKKLKEEKVDELLFKYRLENKIYAGVSAGAILFTNGGMGDSQSYQTNFHTYNFKMVEGLHMLDFYICPHYQKEDLYIFNDEALKYDLSFGIENDTALFIDSNNYKVFKADLTKSVYEFSKNNVPFMKSIY